MTEDFAKKPKGGPAARKGTRQDAPPSTPLAPFLAGCVVGAGALALVWYAGWLPNRDDSSQVAAKRAESVPPPGIRFEFPDLLREAEVLVPYVEEYLQSSTADPEAEYLLQAGAFRTAEDADRRRAAILLLDLDARTLRVTRQGESWHRVLVGPFADRSLVRGAQVRLLEEEIDSIVLKTRRGEAPGA